MKKNTSRFSEQQIQQMISDYQSGVSIPKIAKKLEAPTGTIRGLLVTRKVSMRTELQVDKQIYTWDKAKLEEEYKRLNSLQKVADLYGCHLERIRQVMIEFGLQDLIEKRNGERSKFSNAGPQAPGWKGGRTINSGYVLIHQPEHPRARCDGYVPEQILVWEAAYGPLQPGEEIDHIDRNRSNNDLSNLRKFASHAEHMSFHQYEDPWLSN